MDYIEMQERTTQALMDQGLEWHQAVNLAAALDPKAIHAVHRLWVNGFHTRLARWARDESRRLAQRRKEA